MERLDELMIESFRKRAGQDVFWWHGGWMTAEKMLADIDADRRVLEAAGFTEGQRLMTLVPNCPGLVTLATAVWSLGGTLIPLNMRAGTENLLPTVDLVQPFAVVIGRGDTKASAGVTRYPVVEMDVDGTVDPFRGRVGKATDSGDAVFFATSGTTGLPKAVPLSHGNFIANVKAMREFFYMDENDVHLWALPNFHSFGFTLSLLMPQLSLGKCAAVPSFMPPLATLKTIAAAKCTMLWLVPAMLEFLKRSAAHNDVKITTVRSVVTGGDRLNTALDQASVDLFGHHILEGYGTTECSPVVAVNPSEDRRKLGTIGPVIPGYEWEVRDRNGKALPPEEAGVLFVRGPSVFHGYYQAPQATAERLSPDGWYDTGDVVKYDSDGYLTVLDRMTDIIIVGGFNVYPQEVERVLSAHPAVAQCAVVAMRHLVNGEIPRAFVVLKDGMEATERGIIEYCKGKLANYKIPRKVDFVSELPMSASGKVLRRKLREVK